jgi:hypothetical protein
VGTGKRSPRVTILAIAAIFMLIWLYSRYVLLALVTGYVLLGIVLKLWSMIRRPRHESA